VVREVPAIRKAENGLMMISQDELERQRYLEWQRAALDAVSRTGDVRAAREDLQKAREITRLAREEARAAVELQALLAQEQGIRIGRIQLLRELLQQPETPSEDLDRLPLLDLKVLEGDLKRQWIARAATSGSASSTPARIGIGHS